MAQRIKAKSQDKSAAGGYFWLRICASRIREDIRLTPCNSAIEVSLIPSTIDTRSSKTVAEPRAATLPAFVTYLVNSGDHVACYSTSMRQLIGHLYLEPPHSGVNLGNIGIAPIPVPVWLSLY